jgi:hypothetical protein
MAHHDGSNSKKILWAKIPTSISSNTTTTSSIIDTQGYDKVTFVITSTAYTDGTYTPTIAESNDSGMSGSNSVAASDLTKALSDCAVSAATTNSVDAAKKIGYLGVKRYLTCGIVSTGTSSGATVGVMAILEKADNQPVA